MSFLCCWLFMKISDVNHKSPKFTCQVLVAEAIERKNYHHLHYFCTDQFQSDSKEESPLPHFYRPQTDVMYSQLSVCPRGVSASGPGVPPGQTLPGQTTPWGDTPPLPRADTSPAQCMLPDGQQAGSTYPTGMHSWKKAKPAVSEEKIV